MVIAVILEHDIILYHVIVTICTRNVFICMHCVFTCMHCVFTCMHCVFTCQVCLNFDPKSTKVATGSMDTSAKIWDVETGVELCTLSVSG